MNANEPDRAESATAQWYGDAGIVTVVSNT